MSKCFFHCTTLQLEEEMCIGTLCQSQSERLMNGSVRLYVDSVQITLSTYNIQVQVLIWSISCKRCFHCATLLFGDNLYRHRPKHSPTFIELLHIVFLEVSLMSLWLVENCRWHTASRNRPPLNAVGLSFKWQLHSMAMWFGLSPLISDTFI